MTYDTQKKTNKKKLAIYPKMYWTFSTGTPPNEPTAQECCHGDEGGLPEATRKNLPQDIHPTARQCQVQKERERECFNNQAIHVENPFHE